VQQTAVKFRQNRDILSTAGQRQHLLQTTALSIDGVPVSPVTSVRNLAIYIDSDLVMWTHVQQTVLGCFAALHQLRQIRNFMPTATYVPVSGGRSGNIQTRLQKRCADRSSNTPDSPPPICAESSCTADLHTSDFSITLKMRWSTCTGCASRSASSTRSPYLRSRWDCT